MFQARLHQTLHRVRVCSPPTPLFPEGSNTSRSGGTSGFCAVAESRVCLYV